MPKYTFRGECEAVSLEDEYSIWDGDDMIFSEVYVSGPYETCACCQGQGIVLVV